MNSEPDPPETVPTLAQLGELFGVSTAWMKDVSARDARFPRKGPGYPVLRVALLMRVRKLERQSDADYDAEARASDAALLREIQSGADPWRGFPKATVRRMVRALKATNPDPEGRSARQLELQGLLEDIQ